MNRIIIFLVLISFLGCKDSNTARLPKKQTTTEGTVMTTKDRLDDYIKVTLKSDLSKLTENEKNVLGLLIQAAAVMDDLFWEQAYGDKESLLSKIKDETTKKFILINYGPWDRMDNNFPFVEGVEKKPDGANFYPADMTKEEFEKSEFLGKNDAYSMVRRDENAKLKSIPYHIYFKEKLVKAASFLLEAAKITEDLTFKNYLEKRANALLTDEYTLSDRAWLDMKNNHLDIVIGPIENYEDALFNTRTAYEGYVLIKDLEWSERLSKYTAFLPQLQKNLPVEKQYKAEIPGSDSDLNAYDVVFYAGDCNAGGKTIAINLPNDEKIQLEKGTRRLQLKNVMKEKFDKIMLPISNVLIDPAQRKHVTFDAFFANTMFHEVAHGLGIKNTINGKGLVKDALKANHSAIEEGKADILGVFMVQQLHNRGEINGDIKDYLTTFMAGIFRSIRFGAASDHGKANMIRFNYFKEKGVFSRNNNGTYTIHYDKMSESIAQLSQIILTLQGNGDIEGAESLIKEKGIIDAQLQADLNKLKEAKIPVDLIFEQGKHVLGI